ncbi:MAG: response regulator [Ignavibacteria bacterium]|nr:response regulator [Ignavibacteria bacterium]
MERPDIIKVLFIEDNAEFAKLVKLFLDRAEDGRFEVSWKNNGRDGIEYAAVEQDLDIILMDYFLPGLNGLEITRELQERKIDVPVIFLTVNKDVGLAVEVMKLGVADYLVKEEISTPILPKSIMSVVERHRLEKEVAELEIRKRRLEAMQGMILTIATEVETPLDSMRRIVDELTSMEQEGKGAKYVGIIKDNLLRIESKMEKLKNLKEDKTVKYIKDIRMLDLS